MATTETPVSTSPIAVPPTPGSAPPAAASKEDTWGELRVIRRNGKVTAFDADKITVAVTKAFLAVEGGNAAASARVHDVVRGITKQVTDALARRTARELLPGT